MSMCQGCSRLINVDQSAEVYDKKVIIEKDNTAEKHIRTVFVFRKDADRTEGE